MWFPPTIQPQTSKFLGNSEKHLQGQWFRSDNTMKVQVQKLRAGQFLPGPGKSHSMLWQMPATSLVTKCKIKGLVAIHKNVLYTLLAYTYLCLPPQPPPPPKKKGGERKEENSVSDCTSCMCIHILLHCISHVVLCCRCRMVAIQSNNRHDEMFAAYVLVLNIH